MNNIHDNHTECSEFSDIKCEVCVTYRLYRLLRLACIMSEYLTMKCQMKHRRGKRPQFISPCICVCLTWLM